MSKEAIRIELARQAYAAALNTPKEAEAKQRLEAEIERARRPRR